MPPSVSRWSERCATLRAAERWLLPGSCLLCRGPVEADPQDPLLCGACRNRFAPLPEPQCPRCGQPLTVDVECRLCAEWPAGLSGVRSAVWLDEAARRAVHLLKYEGWWRIAEPMADAMRTLLRCEPGFTLVPIPLSAARLRRRGYNQGGVLGKALARRVAAPFWAPALARRRDTTTQTALTPEARRANLAGAFIARGRSPRRPVLVDDVFTTGATLAEAAAALLGAGAERVSGVTFARAARPLAEAAGALPPR